MQHTPTPPNPPSRLVVWIVILACNLAFSALALSGIAQTPLFARPANDDHAAVLAAVRDLMVPSRPLAVTVQANGSQFVDFQGAAQTVLLVVQGPDGAIAVRCVTTLEEAAAVLDGSDPLTATLLAAGPAAAVRAAIEADASPATILAAAANQFEITFRDDPGIGFNDPTPVAPVGGNNGTTLGEQRRESLRYAAAIWAANLQSTVPIRIDARFANLRCTESSAILGSASPRGLRGNFLPIPPAPGPQPDTLYVDALADKLAGYDLNPGFSDVILSFNGGIGQPGCLTGLSWYYGLDGNAADDELDLITTLLHEIAHGVGFYSGVQSNGQNINVADDIWNSFLFDNTLEQIWRNLTPLQRSQAYTNTGQIVWQGPNVSAAAALLLDPIPIVQLTPETAFTLRQSTAGPPLDPAGITAPLVLVENDDDLGGLINDGCAPLTNAEQISGAIALVDRGACSFLFKARYAQLAGARALIVLDTTAALDPPLLNGSDPSLDIPVLSATLAAGNLLRTGSPEVPLIGTLRFDPTQRAGTDESGRMRMFAPNPAAPGSSISHFDTVALPRLLMEPSINPNIGQSLDLTDELLRDIGWFVDRNYNAVEDCSEVALSLDQTLISTPLRPGDPLALHIDLANSSPGYTATVQLQVAPAELVNLAWTITYIGGASGPEDGVDLLDLSIELPPDSSAQVLLTAELSAATVVVLQSEATAFALPNVACREQAVQAQQVISVADYQIYAPLVQP